MALKKFLVSIVLYFFFTLLQTSFLVHFSFFGLTLNLVLISVIFWNLFESPKSFFGLSNAIIGGFYLDIFSSRIFGFYILISLATAIFIKFFFKKYFNIPFTK